MTITAEAGPQVIYGFTQTSSGAVTEYNEERGPSMNDLGQGMLDPRPAYCYYPGAAVGTKCRGFWNGYAAIDQTLGTVSTACLVANAVPSSVSGTALTLVTSNQGIIVTPGVSLTPPEGGATVTGLLGIEMGPTANQVAGLPAITYGSGGTIAVWDPRGTATRVVNWIGSSNSSADAISVAGRDVYGFKMTETIAGTPGSTTNGATTVTGKKAWKYISAISMVTTGANIFSTAIRVGLADVFGFPLRVDHPAYVTAWFGTSTNATLVSVSSGLHTFGSTNTATSTTPDVRGTYASSAATSSANTVKLVAFVTPSVQNLPTTSFSDNSGLFGVTQFSSV